MTEFIHKVTKEDEGMEVREIMRTYFDFSARLRNKIKREKLVIFRLAHQARHAGVAEWQTRMVQVHVGATPWRFNSSRPHHSNPTAPSRGLFFIAC